MSVNILSYETPKAEKVGEMQRLLAGARVFESFDTSAGNEVLKNVIGVSAGAGVDVFWWRLG